MTLQQDTYTNAAGTHLAKEGDPGAKLLGHANDVITDEDARKLGFVSGFDRRIPKDADDDKGHRKAAKAKADDRPVAKAE